MQEKFVRTPSRIHRINLTSELRLSGDISDIEACSGDSTYGNYKVLE